MPIPEILKGPLMKMVTAQITPVAKSIAANIEAILAQAGEAKGISPFELNMFIKHEANTARGIIKQQDKELFTVDMLPYIVDVYNQCYNNLPEFGRNFVDKEMGNDSIATIICKLLEESPIIVEYNEDDELVPHRLEGDTKHPLKQEDFIQYVKEFFGWE